MSEKLAPDRRHAFVHHGQKIYEWDQSLDEVNVYIDLPSGVKAKQLDCDVLPNHLRVGIKGNPPYLDHALCEKVKKDSSFWTVEDGVLHVTLQKAERGKAWQSALAGHTSLDPLSSEQEQKRLMLERFQQENPGFDFSGAEFSGQVPDPSTFMGGVRNS
ncbi:Nuclear distribution protein C [Klebsormidium nitens]|uniref:Nuclear distribution protein C n=1 Tax=Klebsormidium nitens TaxID=105231 RepID=A0A1Y1I6Z6_KLENI|nr:Nuclear distribution protein C [Klebsormidium nitens]|eukprot:GAQ86724.1 Nuclear distribution protein C [Klebsormidium nitens]